MPLYPPPPTGSGTIANTTNIIKGDGAGGGIASDLVDDGSGSLTFQKDRDGNTNFAIYNGNGDGNDAATITLATGGAGLPYYTEFYQHDFPGNLEILGSGSVNISTDLGLAVGTTETAGGQGKIHADDSINSQTAYLLAQTQVISARKTGWTAPTGIALRTGFATSTATISQLAQTLKALIDDLVSHGLIGT